MLGGNRHQWEPRIPADTELLLLHAPGRAGGTGRDRIMLQVPVCWELEKKFRVRGNGEHLRRCWIGAGSGSTPTLQEAAWVPCESLESQGRAGAARRTPGGDRSVWAVKNLLKTAPRGEKPLGVQALTWKSKMRSESCGVLHLCCSPLQTSSGSAGCFLVVLSL